MTKSSTATEIHPGDHYRIAAVARLTGIPETTIRMWERRYGVVAPARSAGNGRLYSRADIERLQTLKTAVDAGHAIGTVAALTVAQLQQRLAIAPARSGGDAASDSPATIRVTVCGTALAARLREAWAGRDDLRLAGVLSALPTDDTVAPATDVLVVEAPTLPPATLRQLRQLRAQSHALLMVVVYGFGNRQALARLDQDGIIAIPQPADPAHLARLCQMARTLASPTSPATLERRLLQRAAPRRFDDHFLATTARRPSTVRCECPNHLADLLVKLNAFEQYSLECEHSGAEDAAIHAVLYSAAAQCRELLELALHKVLEHEGLESTIKA